MGEYAEMMLDGTCCSICGEYMGGCTADWPVQCRSCSYDMEQNEAQREKRQAPSRKIVCVCGKRFKAQYDYDQHFKAKRCAGRDIGLGPVSLP